MDKFGSMFGDTLASLLKAPITERYPFERREAPDDLRGRLVWNQENCTGCGLCTQDCPAQALEMIVLDRKAKRFVMRYHVDRCTFCAQCLASCRQEGLSMNHADWELAGLSRGDFDLMWGSPEDVEAVLAGADKPEIEVID